MNSPPIKPKISSVCRIAILTVTGFSLAGSLGQDSEITNREGLRMSIDKANRDPAIHVTIGGGRNEERSFNILLPEHVTVREEGQTEARHLYIYRPGPEGTIPKWKQVGTSLEYSKQLSQMGFSARATLEYDGILFHYQFENRISTMKWFGLSPIRASRNSSMIRDLRGLMFTTQTALNF